MIHRTLFLCVAAIVALASVPTTTAFSTAPARVSTSTRGPLKGASSTSRATSTSQTALYAVKKATKKKSSAKKSAKKKDEEVVNFKKADFVAAIAEKTGMTKSESDLALAAVLNVIATVSTYFLCA